MNLRLLFSITFSMMALALFAQDSERQRPNHSTPEEKSVETLGQLEEKIELTDEQRKGIYDIHLEFFTNAQEAMKERDKEKMETLENTRNEKVKDLLGKKLYRKYLSVMNENKPQGPPNGRQGGGRGGRGGMGGPGGGQGQMF
ncbi:hypothetical protein KMW28_05170 [Flammeovirga yaeyamensis]|uniref:Uncharacterized protein n=1 Tax=Flammeovirga yaeyamensis TaxID=367791 RepID=A0AAX1NAE4_9BACT|nr:hypothetical protein [Flammeovirga yaeyamensis]MBB3697550.1 hypothetical protein [Flammeovirga yaeyamensis]NMF36244.1 hypothetical protein [Flammeovirga yaeyamensis]QWG02973.1 hypothetical protein KMW28_05170 [Flammeovirga yaeyamensis]